MPLVKAGKLKAYGVTAEGQDAGIPYRRQHGRRARAASSPSTTGRRLFAPSKTPDAVIKTLNAAVNEVANDPEVLKTWHDTGVEAFPKDMRTPAAGEKFLKSEIARWGKVIKDNDIHVTQ